MSRILSLILLLSLLLTGWACDEPDDKDGPERQLVVQSEAPRESESQPAQKVVSPEAPATIERSLLWRVDGPTDPIWLFGTIHGGVDASQWDALPREVRSAIEDSEVIVLEIDLQAAESPQAQAELAPLMFIPDEKPNLKEQLGDEHWDLLKKRAPLPADMLERFQPWVVFSIFLEQMIAGPEAVDLSIQNHARRLGKELEYLESMEEQVGFLAETIDDEVLADMLTRFEYHTEKLEQMVQAYRRGDADTIERLVYDPQERERFPETHDVLVVERNENWMTTIEEYLQRGRVFIAAGAGHYVGEDGIVEQLRLRGYEVTRVPSSNEK